MKTNIFVKILLTAFFFLLLFSSPTLYAQPPAQGPPPTPTTYQSIGVGILTALLKSGIQETLDSTNARIQRQSDETGVKAKLSFTYKIFKPGMSVTTMKDRPNQNFVRIAYSIEYNVTDIKYHGIPYFSRKINQSIEIHATCQNWFTDDGRVKITTKLDKPYLDDASFAEQALNFFIGNTLLNLVDSKLHQTLPNAFNTSTNLPNSTCNCLGVESGSPPDYSYGEVKYFLKKTFKPPLETAYKQVNVTLKSIKRLPARDDSGTSLYAPLEDIQVILYANQTLRATNLTQIKDGEERSINQPVIILTRPADDAMLVLIGNIEQSSGIMDSRFATFNKSGNFGHGVQKLIIQKTYWTKPRRLPNGQMTKPFENRVDAYEMTIQINAPLPVVNAGKVNSKN